MAFGKVFLFTAASLISVPALAAVIVVGNGAARNCFEAADSPGRPSMDQMRQCDRALTEEGLPPHEVVATHVNRGVLRVRIGKVEEGLADFERAMALDPTEPEAYLNKGAVLLRQGNARAALPLFSIAIDRDTRKPAFAYFGRAVAHEDLGDLKSAYLDYRRASTADPKWKQPRREMARFIVRQGG